MIIVEELYDCNDMGESSDGETIGSEEGERGSGSESQYLQNCNMEINNKKRSKIKKKSPCSPS